MKITKNKTVIALILALVLSFAAGITATYAKVNADEPETITSTDYFNVNGSSASTDIKDGALNLKMKDGDAAEFKRDLLVNDFQAVVNVPAAFAGGETATKFVITAAAGLKNGVQGDDDEYKTEVKCEVNLAAGKNTVKAVLQSGKLKVSATPESGSETSKTYEVEVFGGNVVGKIGFEVKADAEADLAIEYIDQRASESSGDWKQTFALTEGKLTEANSVVLLNKNFYNGAEPLTGKRAYEAVSVTFTEYSVVKSSTSSSSFKLEAAEGFEDDVWISSDGKKFRLKTLNKQVTLNIVTGEDDNKKVYSSFNVKGVNDGVAPVYAAYNEDSEAIKAFKKKLLDATMTEYDTENGKEKHYIRLGSSNYLEIPTMADFVSDNLTNYSDLTYTVYYRSNNSDWTTTTSFRIPVANEGKYQFYVLFTDLEKNAMEDTDFKNKDGEFDGKYKDYVFEFEVYNDAPISLTAASQEKAYKGISYTAASFTVLAKDYEIEYSLYYSKDGVSDWTEIPAVADLKEGTADYKSFKDYEYDGNLTFNPAKIGYYKIEAKLYENGTLRSAEAETVIQAASAPVRVVPNENNWFLNNVWSIVFLSIGTLSLVGIIVVLCIKPKDEESK